MVDHIVIGRECLGLSVHDCDLYHIILKPTRHSCHHRHSGKLTDCMSQNGQQPPDPVTNMVRIPSLNALLLYTAYHPEQQSSVGQGFILAEPVHNERDILVYPAGTEITHKEISRLIG